MQTGTHTNAGLRLLRAACTVWMRRWLESAGYENCCSAGTGPAGEGTLQTLTCAQIAAAAAAVAGVASLAAGAVDGWKMVSEERIATTGGIGLEPYSPQRTNDDG